MTTTSTSPHTAGKWERPAGGFETRKDLMTPAEIHALMIRCAEEREREGYPFRPPRSAMTRLVVAAVVVTVILATTLRFAVALTNLTRPRPTEPATARRLHE
jgi:hypothetical protein